MTNAVQGSNPLPTKFELTSDAEQNLDKWTAWRSSWTRYAVVAKLKDESAEYRHELFCCCLDEEVLSLVETLTFESEEERKDVTKLIAKLDEYFRGQTNEIYETFKFFTRDQEATESLTDYIAALKKLSKTCNFGTLRDRLVRDKIVCGIRNFCSSEGITGGRDTDVGDLC